MPWLIHNPGELPGITADMIIFKIRYFVTWLYIQKGEYWLIFPSTIQLNFFFFLNFQ